jgi:hypothetical protein
MVRLAVLSFVSFAIASVAPQAPAPPEVTCPRISVSCPSSFSSGQPLIFTAYVTGGDGIVNLAYSWELFSGKIIQGEGTSSIVVDMTGFGGQSPTATVTIHGLPANCSSTASCSILIEPPPPLARKFGAYDERKRVDEIAQLHLFAVQLENEPSSRGYILSYYRQQSRAREARLVARRARNFLVREGIQADRIVIVAEGLRSTPTIELWVVPIGGIPPAASATVDSPGLRSSRSPQ